MSQRLIGAAAAGIVLAVVGLVLSPEAFAAELAFAVWLAALGAALYWPGRVAARLLGRPVGVGESLLFSLGTFLTIMAVLTVLNSTGAVILDSQEKEYRRECMRLGGANRHCQKEYYALADAVGKYTEALAADPANALHYRNRGSSWYRMRKYDRAIADYAEAVRLDPQNASIYDNLGAAHAEAGNFTEAVRWEEKALADAPFAKAHGEEARKRLELYRKQQPYRSPYTVRTPANRRD
jgi:tetratricopeptide (TPR) repeat protein